MTCSKRRTRAWKQSDLSSANSKYVDECSISRTHCWFFGFRRASEAHLSSFFTHTHWLWNAPYRLGPAHDSRLPQPWAWCLPGKWAVLRPASTSLSDGLWTGSLRWNKSSSHLNCFGKSVRSQQEGNRDRCQKCGCLCDEPDHGG